MDKKAKWDCLPVSYLDARFTSSLCPICGFRLEPNGHRVMKCNNCGLELNRDVIACLNLLKMKGAWFPPDSLRMTSTSDEGRGKLTCGWCNLHINR